MEVECNLLPFQLLNHKLSDFEWVKSSVQQDKLVAKHKGGSFSVLQVKNKGTVSNFVLDPNLCSAFWDNEEVSGNGQHLFAQMKNGDVLLYGVDTEGVTEKLHLPFQRLSDAVKVCNDGRVSTQLKLVGCEGRQIVLFDGAQTLFSAQVSLKSKVHVNCSISVPQKEKADAQRPSRFCIQNGSVAVADLNAGMMFVHSLTNGHCFSQVDLKPLGIEPTSVCEWRLLYDFSVLVLLLIDWTVMRVELSAHPALTCTSVDRFDHGDQERSHHQEYLSYNLCWYGDVSWKRDVVAEHASVSGATPIKTKKKSTGFGSKARVKESSGPTLLSPKSKDVLSLGSTYERLGWTLEAMETSLDVVALVFKNGNAAPRPEDRKALFFANFRDKVSHVRNMNDSTAVILSNLPACSNMLLSEKFLLFLSPHVNLQKDDLITKMMSYSGPGSADDLCQANQWTRTAVPFLALEASLQQRQLDTLAFFFKSKQNLFSMWYQQPSGHWSVAGAMQQLEDALRLVMATASVTDAQAKIFGERLLSLTLEFFYELLEDAKLVAKQIARSDRQISAEKEYEIKENCQILLSYTQSLRQCLQALKPKQGISSTQPLSESSSFSAVLWKPSLPTTFESHVKENQLSSLQSQQMDTGNEKPMVFKEIVEELLDKVDTYLKSRDISACQQILNNLGCDVLSTLWHLAQFYPSRPLQQFVTDQLSRAAALSPAQRHLVQYVEQLYEAYPCVSFSTAMKEKAQNPNGSWSEGKSTLKNVLVSNNVFLLSQCGELESTDLSTETREQSAEDNLYACLLLAWMSSWTDNMKRSVMVDSHFLRGGEALASLKTDDITWEFLIAHNFLEELLTLLESSEKDHSFPLSLNPTQSLHLGWSHLKNKVAAVLLRLKKLDIELLPEQGINLNTMLPIVGGPMMKPHPLSYLGPSKVQEVHNKFLKHCVASSLQLPLWMYCAVHGLNPSDLKITQPCSWFPVLQAFYAIPRHPTDKTVMLSASLMSAAELWSTTTGEAAFEMMLEKKQILAAVGTLSYMSQDELKLSPAKIEQYLQKFPKLMAALLPEGHKAVAKENTTVYQLLMGTTPFDLRRLFGWQYSNTYAREDSPQVMPHFSESTLSPHNTQHARLSFPYYLKQGRPVYAFLSFLSEELDRVEALLSQKRLQQACGAATWLACQNFNTPRVSSACVVFVELLGKDSILLRTLVNCGRVLLAYRHPKPGAKQRDKKESKDSSSTSTAGGRSENALKSCVAEIVSELLSSLHKKHNQKDKLIKSVEEAVKEEIRTEGIGSCSFEASQKWTLVLMLCQLLSAPLSTSFLRACAETNNWLMFVWFAQLHQYPAHQLQNLLQSFSSLNLRDHLHYVLNNAGSRMFTAAAKAPSRKNSLEEQRSNQRISLYNRIGVQKTSAIPSSDEEEEAAKGTTVISSFTARLKETELNESEMVESSAPDDVFRMLFYSRSMPCQWKCLLSASVALRNPLFAELAACCGCPPIPSVCGWLLASLETKVKKDFLSQHGQHIFKWSFSQLETLITTVLVCKQEDTLATAFTILQPTSPLLPFMCFINECVRRGTYAACKTFVDQFKDAIASWDDKSAQPSSNDLPTIGDRAWFEKVAYQVLQHELKVTNNLYHARHLLQILDRQNVCLVFSFDVLNFAVLHKVVTILHANPVPDLNLACLLTSGTESKLFRQQVESALDHLMAAGLFSQAQELAEAAGVGRETVAVNQLRQEKQQLLDCGLWSAKFVRAQFWGKCQKMLGSSDCAPKTCAEFFEEEIQGTHIEVEKARLYEQWYSLMEDGEEPEQVEAKNAVFREMWRHRIAAKIALEEVEPLDLIFDTVDLRKTKQGDLKTELLGVSSELHSVCDIQEDLTSQELEVLDSLMGVYLDQACVAACARVAAVFGHYNQDLAIIQTCIALANGTSRPDNIEPAMRRLLAKQAQRKIRTVSMSRTRSLSSSSLASITSAMSEVSVNVDPQDMTSVMEKLYSHCVKGRQVCLRIITCFKIAEMLDMEYKEVIQRSEFDSLRQLLRISHHNKFAVARDFLTSSGLSDDEVTGFLADSIVEVLKMFVKGDTSNDQDEESSLGRPELMFNPTDGMEVFSQFMNLCENTSLLGDRILQAATSLFSSNQEEMTPKVLTIQTELIIMAHECYTIASSMEGISHVLRMSRVCCNSLTEAKEYGLMIRLLTGVGRYGEMVYIFHALQQHHQFELLLRKGMDREDKLKVAILDYLKRYQPDDSEAYTMVALKFSMYRDIAAMLEACGHRALKHLKDRSFDNSKETQESLKKCLQYFQDAAESYVKDNSVRKAQHCVKLARLVSLQLQLLPSGVTVIHMTRDQVTVFTNAHSRFIEAMVVADAYERRMDWSDAVYNNVVSNNDMRYLQEMKLHVVITPALVEDVVKKYKNANPKPSGALPAIRKLLTSCKDARLQYQLAMDLGLTDIVTAMLKADTGSFLQDVTVMTM